ncbi:LOW QUALITY PROTEIN: uncharacterized protein LOC107509213 [Rousettus aegyptiacus]|uniref:LOW QUALITY PROTEIN: uncharacterized protein LOC107509213 n=1 Tax=Rousettus aegyptiacus TaxID=9407 RepID=UPI00168CDB0D|nr:LOW QUALITY PROTEIN: uncharacterized protein LOC107509213 [Rousettus aegyptiacus]
MEDSGESYFWTTTVLTCLPKESWRERDPEYNPEKMASARTPLGLVSVIEGKHSRLGHDWHLRTHVIHSPGKDGSESQGNEAEAQITPRVTKVQRARMGCPGRGDKAKGGRNPGGPGGTIPHGRDYRQSFRSPVSSSPWTVSSQEQDKLRSWVSLPQGPDFPRLKGSSTPWWAEVVETSLLALESWAGKTNVGPRSSRDPRN